MKSIISISVLAILLTFCLSSFHSEEHQVIKWYSFEEGLELAKKEKKNVFIDVYTEWCGWCKKMDGSTFLEPEVIKYLNNNFISIRLDAESRDTIKYMSNDYVYVPNERNGYNQIAPALLDNQLSFPSFVILDTKGKRLHKSSGYLSKEQLITKLRLHK